MRPLYHRLCSEILAREMHQKMFRETSFVSILYTSLANKISFIPYVHICLALCHEKATYVAFFLEILKKKLPYYSNVWQIFVCSCIVAR